MRKLFAAVAIAIAALFGSSSTVDAAFQVRITTTSGLGGTVLVQDELAAGAAVTVDGAATVTTKADATPGTPGAISWSGSIGNFAVTFTSALSKPLMGSPAFPQMDLNFSVTKLVGSVADDIKIEATDTGFTTSPIGLYAGIGGSVLNNVTSLTYQTFFSNNNGEFNTSGGSSVQQTFTGSPYAGVNVLSVTGAAPYSLTQVVIVHGGAGSASASGDATLNAVPAPPGLLLALTGMPVLGLGAWLRRRRSTTAV